VSRKPSYQTPLQYLGDYVSNGAFAHDVKSMLNENLGGILDGTQC
jgi:hypothetical protein